MIERIVRADAHRALMRALHIRAGGARIETSTSEPWASVTFTGARHSATLRLEGPDAGLRATRFTDAIDVAEFTLPGHILADITIVAMRSTPDAAFIDLEALTVEEA